MKKIITSLLSLMLCLGGVTPMINNTPILAATRDTYQEGYTAGYEYEKKNAKTNFASTSGSAEYKRGYENGWYKAYDELVSEATDLAIANAKLDVEAGKRNHSTPPKDLAFKSLYRTTYKASYDDYKSGSKNEVALLAEENAKKDCWNLKKRDATPDFIDKTLRTQYRDAYNEAYTLYPKYSANGVKFTFSSSRASFLPLVWAVLLIFVF